MPSNPEETPAPNDAPETADRPRELHVLPPPPVEDDQTPERTDEPLEELPAPPVPIIKDVTSMSDDDVVVELGEIQVSNGTNLPDGWMWMSSEQKRNLLKKVRAGFKINPVPTLPVTREIFHVAFGGVTKVEGE